MRRTLNALGLVSLALAPFAPVLNEAHARAPYSPSHSAAHHAGEEIAYGKDPLQKLDFWRGSKAGAPLVIYIHGGGWKRGDKKMMRGSAKLAHWQALGYAVASLNYRLVPQARVEQQASDVAEAIAMLNGRAGALGFDPQRTVLIGHSAGAHLAALVGTDPHYLRHAGLGLDALSGVVLLDGAAYDVPSQMDKNTRLLGNTYQQAFGTERARQLALSPSHHAAAPNVGNFLLLHVERKDSTRQSEALAKALRKAGTSAQVFGLKGRGLRGHMQINRKLGEEDYRATALVDSFLARLWS